MNPFETLGSLTTALGIGVVLGYALRDARLTETPLDTPWRESQTVPLLRAPVYPSDVPVDPFAPEETT